VPYDLLERSVEDLFALIVPGLSPICRDTSQGDSNSYDGTQPAPVVLTNRGWCKLASEQGCFDDDIQKPHLNLICLWVGGALACSLE